MSSTSPSASSSARRSARIVTSLVGDIIMPIIGAITGGLDFSNYFTALSKSVTATNLADAKKQGAVLAWGNFLTLTLEFHDRRFRAVSWSFAP